MKKLWILRVIGFVLLMMALLSVVVTLLWNALLPHLFHFPIITYWEALGLLILCRILFGGKGHHGGGERWKGAWRARWEAKLAKMSPEEREKFRAEWQKKCGPWKWENHGKDFWNDPDAKVENSTGGN